MRVVESVEEMRAVCRELRGASEGGRALGLVPTMGALHAGHLSLVRAAREGCAEVAATIFVNPTQFGPGEDFGRYPRTFAEDCRKLEGEGVAAVFAPSAGAMYPAGVETFVDVAGVGGRLDGAARPGHFRGVATVVAKLFHICGPDRAYFGQKDAAQVAVIRKMVRDLNFGVDVVVCPTVREADGLALSSRNRYLSAEERARAVGLSRALRCVQAAVAAGEREAGALRELMLGELGRADGVRVEYAEIVDADTLERIEDVRDGGLAAVAARVGETRLIDNLVIAAEGMRPR